MHQGFPLCFLWKDKAEKYLLSIFILSEVYIDEEIFTILKDIISVLKEKKHIFNVFIKHSKQIIIGDS